MRGGIRYALGGEGGGVGFLYAIFLVPFYEEKFFN